MHRLPDVTDVRRIAGSFRWGFVRGGSLVTGELAPPLPDGRLRRLIRTYPVPDGVPETNVGIVTNPPGVAGAFEIDPAGEWMLGIFDGSIFEVSLRHARPLPSTGRPWRRGPDRFWFKLSPDGTRIYTYGKSGALRVVVARDRRAAVDAAATRRSAQISRNHHRTRREMDGRRTRQWSRSTVNDVELRHAGVEPRFVRVWWPAAAGMAMDAGRFVDGRTGHSDAVIVAVNDAPPARPAAGREELVRSLVIDPGSRWIAAGGDALPGSREHVVTRSPRAPSSAGGVVEVAPRPRSPH